MRTLGIVVIVCTAVSAGCSDASPPADAHTGGTGAGGGIGGAAGMGGTGPGGTGGAERLTCGTGDFTGVVGCGSEQCNVGDEECCVHFEEGAECVPKGECERPEWVPVGCDDASDCATDQVCCEEHAFNFTQWVDCTLLPCAGDGLDGGYEQVCDPGRWSEQ